MTGSHDIRIERVLDTTPEIAFRQWVDTDARRRWYAPEPGWTIEAEADLRVGGAWRVRYGPSATEMYTEEGTFTEMDPPHRLAYTATFRYPDGRSFETHITVTFTPRGDKTLLTFVESGYPSAQQRDYFAHGWPDFLDAYEQTLAPSHGATETEGTRRGRSV